jgi:hypothetical protein
MSGNHEMAQIEAAERIVAIQQTLAESFLGEPKRAELMTEQRKLWDEFYPGRPYDEISKDGWMHRLLKWG